MATKKQISRTYNWMEKVFLLSLGMWADITNALFRGNFTLSLAAAQKRKHQLIVEKLGLTKGKTLLDIGCGWGPLMHYCRTQGINATGLTLSTGQYTHCRKHKFKTYLQSWEEFNTRFLFDGIAAVGSFEHFCSVNAYLRGRQDDVYRKFFKYCYDHSVPESSLYMQMMMWGKEVPNYLKDILGQEDAEKYSYSWHLNRLSYFYPGSWLAADMEQLKRCAAGYYELEWEEDGTADYIHTMKQWSAAFKKFSWRKWTMKQTLIGRYLLAHINPLDRAFRYQIEALQARSNQWCFEQGIMCHKRMVFKRVN